MSVMRAWCAIALLLVCARPVYGADPDTTQRAAQLEQDARAAYAKGDYDRAAELFDQANRLAPFAELRYNAALAWDQAGEKARAADAYEGAVRRGGLDDERARESGARLAELKRELCYVRVERPVRATVSVAHVQKAPVPVELHLPSGTHELTFELPDGRVEKKTIEARAGEALSVGVSFAEPNQLATRERPESPQPTVKDESGTSTRTWGFVLVGTGVVLGGVSTYLGFKTLDEQKTFDDSGYRDVDAHDRGVTYRTWTNVALAGAVVAAGTGVTLLLVGSGSKKRSAQTLRVGVSGNHVFGRLAF
jgi:hypothetical protein